VVREDLYYSIPSQPHICFSVVEPSGSSLTAYRAAQSVETSKQTRAEAQLKEGFLETRKLNNSITTIAIFATIKKKAQNFTNCYLAEFFNHEGMLLLHNLLLSFIPLKPLLSIVNHNFVHSPKPSSHAIFFDHHNFPSQLSDKLY
jgi:hypothetical protein